VKPEWKFINGFLSLLAKSIEEASGEEMSDIQAFRAKKIITEITQVKDIM